MQAFRSGSPTPVTSVAPGILQTQQQLQQQQLLQQQQQSSPRRLLAKFTSGLTTKPRSINEFRICLDEPHRQCSNGDSVKGHVKLHVLRPIRITHIVISLTGHVQVYKNPTTSGERAASSAGGQGAGTRGQSATAGRYHGNGYATLFEDEMILCGDGRLADRTYQFNFELQFPTRELPSSVDFERGTIAYTITATLTKPSTISTPMTTERPVIFTERIDISPIFPPKARTIILDPISKRSKQKAQAIRRKEANDRRIPQTPSEQADSAPASARLSSSSQDGERALSPVPSEVSQDSRVSSNGVTSANGSVTASPAASFVGRSTHSKTGNGHKTITTIIQPTVGGCLRGDQVAVNLKVHHTKYMKSMNGVIVTLYRTARVDTHPALPIGPLDGSKGKEEYFSRSFTGLGGLSLSGAGTSHVFRKDLAQVVMPLVVKPTTLTAEVTAKVRVPEDAFPTISGVPGGMISFKYYLEVIVDVQGRLAAPEKTVTGLGELTNTSMTTSAPYEMNWTTTASSGLGILNTSYVKRDKAVVSGSFEIVVGTVDNERRKGKQRAVVPTESPAAEPVRQETIPADPPTFDSILGSHVSTLPAGNWTPTNGYRQDEYSYGSTALLAPPSVPEQSHLTEKQQIQLAEARLLPSAPPDMDDGDETTIPRATGPHISEHGEVHHSEPAPRDEYATRPEDDEYETYTSGAQHSHLEDAPLSAQHHTTNQRSAIQADTMLPQGTAAACVAEEASSAVAAAPVPPPIVATTSADAGADAHDSHADASAYVDLPRYER